MLGSRNYQSHTDLQATLVMVRDRMPELRAVSISLSIKFKTKNHLRYSIKLNKKNTVKNVIQINDKNTV